MASPAHGHHAHHDADAPLDPLLSEDEEQDLATFSGPLYPAGQCPPPGLYRQVDGSRTVEIHEGNTLPPSFDGRVAWYRRVERLWGQLEEQRT